MFNSRPSHEDGFSALTLFGSRRAPTPLEDDIWKARYEASFGPLLDEKHVKAQFTAATMLNTALKMRADLAQLAFRELIALLDQYAECGWALYMKGKLLFEGLHVIQNKAYGKLLLTESIERGDYRAVGVLLAGFLGHVETTLVKYFNPALKTKAIELARAAFDKGSGEAALALGLLHYRQAQTGEALHFFKQAIYARYPNVEGVKAITYILSLELELGLQLAALDVMVANCNPAAKDVMVELHVARAAVYFEMNDRANKLKAYQEATNYGSVIFYSMQADALFSKVRKNAEHRHPQSIVQVDSELDVDSRAALALYYKGVGVDAHANHDYFELLLFRCLTLQLADYASVEVQLRELYLQGNHAIALVVMEWWMNNGGLDVIQQDPLKVWWLQMGLHGFCRDYVYSSPWNAIDKLPLHKMGGYLGCLMGMVCLFGAVRVGQPAWEVDKAVGYFNYAYRKDPVQVVEYFRVGRESGFLVPELEKELRTLPLLNSVLLQVEQQQLSQPLTFRR